MKKIASLLICLCLAFLIHFHGGSLLKVDKLGDNSNDYYGRRAYITAVKDGKVIIIPWFNVLYIEEVS